MVVCVRVCVGGALSPRPHPCNPVRCHGNSMSRGEPTALPSHPPTSAVHHVPRPRGRNGGARYDAALRARVLHRLYPDLAYCGSNLPVLPGARTVGEAWAETQAAQQRAAIRADMQQYRYAAVPISIGRPK